jgi:hypothetical protein
VKTFLYLCAGALVVGCAYWAYQVNYDTQEAIRRVDGLRAQIAAEREALSVLNAEWAYLTRPDRLRVLAEANFSDLQLMPMTAGHFADPAMVAYPKSEIDLLIAQLASEAAE